eukprot:65939-Pelagomonas_calceolata.AAC.1
MTPPVFLACLSMCGANSALPYLPLVKQLEGRCMQIKAFGTEKCFPGQPDRSPYPRDSWRWPRLQSATSSGPWAISMAAPRWVWTKQQPLTVGDMDVHRLCGGYSVWHSTKLLGCALASRQASLLLLTGCTSSTEIGWKGHLMGMLRHAALPLPMRKVSFADGSARALRVSGKCIVCFLNTGKNPHETSSHVKSADELDNACSCECAHSPLQPFAQHVAPISALPSCTEAARMSIITHERSWQTKVVQTWKPGKHYSGHKLCMRTRSACFQAMPAKFGGPGVQGAAPGEQWQLGA